MEKLSQMLKTWFFVSFTVGKMTMPLEFLKIDCLVCETLAEKVLSQWEQLLSDVSDVSLLFSYFVRSGFLPFPITCLFFCLFACWSFEIIIPCYIAQASLELCAVQASLSAGITSVDCPSPL